MQFVSTRGFEPVSLDTALVRGIADDGGLYVPDALPTFSGDDFAAAATLAEVAATLSAARSGWPKRRLVLVFQPHRYTRTRDLMDDFAQVLSECDVLVLLDVYAAGEAPIAGADGRAIARAVRTRGSIEPVFVETLDELPAVLADVLQEGDLVLTMGAGDIGAFAATLPKLLAGKPTLKVHS